MKMRKMKKNKLIEMRKKNKKKKLMKRKMMRILRRVFCKLKEMKQ
jgi:hypothetical protein